jgi:hypothetical protein
VLIVALVPMTSKLHADRLHTVKLYTGEMYTGCMQECSGIVYGHSAVGRCLCPTLHRAVRTASRDRVKSAT